MPNKKKEQKKAVKPELSKVKKKIFWGITILFPFLLLILLEVILRIINYGGNLDLFVDGPAGYEEYYTCNQNVARRYFYTQSTIPSPPTNLFLKEKPTNGYRIFVLGESSAAGFPYGNNASFPNVLQRGLSNAFPEKQIEVVSVAMSAINSYTLLDLVDEIVEQSPDALLIYTGHNEYYGALGVGSVQSLGNSRWLIKTFLNLQYFKSFILLRDIIGWIKSITSDVLSEDGENDASATLMERIVGEQQIPYGSDLYIKGKEQFKDNMQDIIRIAKVNNIPVVLSELVSNLKDQPPFISIKDQKQKSADDFFKAAKDLERKGDYKSAEANYIRAKDMDALRFRAPEEFNSIIHDLAKKYSLPVVPSVKLFKEASPNGLIGNNLMLEHLHPNKEGYFLLAKAFYETMKQQSMIAANWSGDKISPERNIGVTALDSVHAVLSIMQLKSGWPFRPKTTVNRFLQTFKPQNYLEELSFRILSEPGYKLILAHADLARHYESNNMPEAALQEYLALLTMIPYEPDFYRSAATILITLQQYNRASDLLKKSLRYKKSDFAHKWIGQIAFINGDYSSSINHLLKADMNDPQAVFNLSRAFYLNGQWDSGEEYYQRLKSLNQNSGFVAFLDKLKSELTSK